MARKKKAILNISTTKVAAKSPSVSSHTSGTSTTQNDAQNANPDALVFDSDGEELMHSPLVHPSAGMIPRKLHDTILLLDQNLGVGRNNTVGGTNPQGNGESVDIGDIGGNNTEPGVVEPPIVKEPWKNLFTGSKMASKGASLSFVTPVLQDGKKIAQLQEDEMNELTEKWKSSMVMYVVGDSPTIASVKRYMEGMWNSVAQPQVFYHDDGYFSIKFVNMKDRNQIIAGGPYTFYGKPVIIKPWTANFNFYEEVLRVIPLWVRFPNLPLNCWGCDSLSRIGSLLGVPLFADECTTRQDRVSFARVLIEMDITSPLPDCVWIEDSKGGMFKQAVTYDWLPQYCKVCCTAGHDCTKKTKPPVPKPVAKKVWVPKAVQQAHPMSEQQEQPNAVHTPEMPVNNVSDPTPWKIVTRRTKGLSRMRTLSPSNPFTVLPVELSFKELTGGDMEMQNTTEPPDEEETRVKESNFSRVVNKFGRNWKWENNYTANPRGRIWVGWLYQEVDIHVLQVHEQFIHCEIRDRYGVVELYVTLVYGLHSIDTRKNLWNSLTTLASSVGSCPWVITGDFNSPLFADDRINGTPVSATETKDFDEFITSNGLCPVKSVGHYFSWHKGTGEDKVEGGRPFRFLNYLADHSSFSAIIQAAFTEVYHGTPMFKLWCKLKKVKAELKKLHREDFSGITEKITIARSELDKVQQSLQTGRSPALLNQEVVCIKQLRHWLRIDEIALRQKSRIQWLKLGDSNNHFFFSTVKERVRFNSIAILYDDNGTKLVDPDLIQTEILSFYKKLLGTSANTLPSIHIPTVRNGSRLNNDARQDLCRDVTDDEIDLALHGIGNDKAPGPDGLNAVFFKKAWPVIKQDIYRAVKDVFVTNFMLPQYNCTSITLIPKVPNPTRVKEYRPIACCNVVYKIVSKILTTRMQGVIGQVVSECQSGFIPERQISDNILLATELTKGYTRAHLSPRCMLKIDLKKAYDSIEWPFLISVMDALGFPHRFVQWVYTCISTVSYSVLINGKPCTPFKAKKGLRQGDPLSPFLFAIGMEYLSRHLHQLQTKPDFNFHPRCAKLALTHLMFADDLLLFCRADLISIDMMLASFKKFSLASGLEANMDKSNIYVGGVYGQDKADILNAVSTPEGSFPFRYLGVPLSTKKLKYTQCRPLIEKVLARAKVWTVKHLSYAGRLQLVQTILLSLQSFWCQIFILPKKVIKEIQGYCRVFLWTGNTDPSKKALVAWHKLCLPKVAGGLNLKDMCWWNKAAVAKLLWAITYKKDRLWCKWVHAYYIKGRDVGSTQWPVNMSWPLRKILNSQSLIDSIGGWSAVSKGGVFSIQIMYHLLMGPCDKVSWRRIIFHNKASPKSLFVSWLAVLGRLPTLDRLLKWKIVDSNVCPLCSCMPESTQHLFFECSYSAAIWSSVLACLQFHRPVSQLDNEVVLMTRAAKRTGDRFKLLLMFFAECLYGIWLQRNAKVYTHSCRSPLDLLRDIKYRVACRATDQQRNLLLM
ncbi:uncharacterized protein [Spinacia oleracea]|uniref:Reverse transcriptase domain-containing protein n=1 Tax=Spinacia oleracea TaxID=3562 RepID=A0ABM3RP15_SPIOL|nr:uncharacterized protein LOC110775811 [Spinacia oleracea]